MAAVTLLGSTFTTDSGAKTVTATPAAGDLIVICVVVSNDSTWSNPTDDQSGTYTAIGTQVLYATDDSTFDINGRMYIRDTLISSATSTVFTLSNPGFDSGGGLAVLKVTGMSKVGSAAVRQLKADYTNTSSTTNPTTGTWASSRLTTNPVIGFVVNNTNPAGMTPTAGFTELLDTGYSSTTTGVEIQSRDSGDTGDTMVWTRAASYWACIGVELDATSSGNFFLCF